MLGFLLRWSINLFALAVTTILIDGIRVENIETAVLAAGILGVVNSVIRPVVLILTLPINVLSLGLFTLVINAFMLKLVSIIVPGLLIERFFPEAFFGALIVSVTSWMLNIFVAGDGRLVFIKKAGKKNELQ